MLTTLTTCGWPPPFYPEPRPVFWTLNIYIPTGCVDFSRYSVDTKLCPELNSLFSPLNLLHPVFPGSVAILSFHLFRLKAWPCLWLLPHTPRLIHKQIIWVLTSKYIKNPVTSYLLLLPLQQATIIISSQVTAVTFSLVSWFPSCPLSVCSYYGGQSGPTQTQDESRCTQFSNSTPSHTEWKPKPLRQPVRHCRLCLLPAPLPSLPDPVSFNSPSRLLPSNHAAPAPGFCMCCVSYPAHSPPGFLPLALSSLTQYSLLCEDFLNHSI